MAKILVLDDDRMSLKIVEKVFSNGGHEAVLAASCTEAWDKLREHVMVDLVVLDNQLNREWGWQFMLPLRSTPLYRGLPVVVYTAQAERDSAVFYIERGVQNMRLKPYQGDVLLAELEKALRTNWPATVMVPAETICAAQGIGPEAYAALLESSARAVDEAMQLVQARLVYSDFLPLIPLLDQIGQHLNLVGIGIADGLVSKIKKGVQTRDLLSASDGLKLIDALLRLIGTRIAAEAKKATGATAPLAPGG
jgi:CheY-like chemotaxis protein